MWPSTLSSARCPGGHTSSWISLHSLLCAALCSRHEGKRKLSSSLFDDAGCVASIASFCVSSRPRNCAVHRLCFYLRLKRPLCRPQPLFRIQSFSWELLFPMSLRYHRLLARRTCAVQQCVMCLNDSRSAKWRSIEESHAGGGTATTLSSRAWLPHAAHTSVSVPCCSK